MTARLPSSLAPPATRLRRMVFAALLTCALPGAAGAAPDGGDNGARAATHADVAAEDGWLRAHAHLRYAASPASGPVSVVRNGRHFGLAADYMYLLEARLGVRFEFVPVTGMDEALKALREHRVDLIAPMAALPVPDGAIRFTRPLLLPPGEEGRGLSIAVRGDWPQLVGSIERAHRALPPAELESLRQRWQPAPAPGYTPQQVTLVVLTLTAGSLALTLLVVLWSARRRRRLAREIARNEALFDAFFSASPAGMAILDRDLRFVRINATLAALYGQPPDRLPGQAFEQMAPPLAAAVAPLMREVMLDGRPIHNVEVSGRDGNDRERHWLASFFPIGGRNGQGLLGVGQVVIDIADRKRAELALRESENRLRNVSNHLPVAVFQFRLHAAGTPGFTYVSEGITRLLGTTAEDTMRAPERFMQAIHPDDRRAMRACLARAVEGRPEGGEVEWIGRRHPDLGPALWLQIRATVDTGDDGRVSVNGVILDITQLQNAQAALERSRAELRRLSAHREDRVEREHRRLAREFHDELGQVLTTARMHLQLLERHLAAGAVTRIHDTVRDLDSMLSEVYRSVKNIAADLRPPALNLGLAAAVEWLASRLLAPARIRCQIDIDAAADTLDDDVTIALFRVIQESLSNVVRHAGASEVGVALRRAGDTIVLDIRDNGGGFDAGGVDRTTHFGLLGISERTAALGGTLEIDSAAGRGTRLTITLPAAAGSSERKAPSS